MMYVRMQLKLWTNTQTGLRLRREVFRMSNMWNEEIMERLYNEAYDELVADGMDEKEAEIHAADLAIIRFEEI
jgi:hypothetical protein